MWDYDEYGEREERPPDPAQEEVRELLRVFFNERNDTVFFSRQVEVLHEHLYFHWITNRAIRDLIEEGEIRTETRKLSTGGNIKLLWHRSFRYYRRTATDIVKLVEEYSDPNIGAALGLHGELMVLEGFARNQFVLHGREVRSFNGCTWNETQHDIDFVFAKDSIIYGVEVKNTLPYMVDKEFRIKIRLCQGLGIRPVFVVRMMPKHWVVELDRQGGFALILKYQLYPWTHRELAKRVSAVLGLPVDAPRALADGTMLRFVRWHERNK